MDTSATSAIGSRPSTEWILAHRGCGGWKEGITQGSSLTASLYRMYEYLVAGRNDLFMTEMQTFYDEPSWSISAIPDPKDPDPQRYAFLACLPHYLTAVFKRLREAGVARGASLASEIPKDEKRHASDMPYEEQPNWVADVPALKVVLMIPNEFNHVPATNHRALRFLEMNIIVESPRLVFESLGLEVRRGLWW